MSELQPLLFDLKTKDLLSGIPKAPPPLPVPSVLDDGADKKMLLTA